LVEEALGEQVPDIPLVPLLQELATNDSDATVHRSNHTKCPSTQMQESLESHLVQVMESIVLNDDDPVNGVQPLLAYTTSSDPNILNLKQAMLAPNKKYFLKVMRQEFDSHTKQKHWVFVLQSLLLRGTKVLLPVWAMCRKCRIATGVVYKWKACLNIHGGQQVKGVHYWETYSLMVRWASI